MITVVTPCQQEQLPIGRDDQGVGVDRPLRHRAHAPDLHDAPVPHAHVAPVAGRAGAIDDRAVLDQEIESHGRSILRWCRVLSRSPTSWGSSRAFWLPSAADWR